MQFFEDQIPNGGWYFLEGNLKLEGDTWKELVEAVAAHRMNNGKPTGDPEEEIEKQITERLRKLNEHIP